MPRHSCSGALVTPLPSKKKGNNGGGAAMGGRKVETAVEGRRKYATPPSTNTRHWRARPCASHSAVRLDGRLFVAALGGRGLTLVPHWLRCVLAGSDCRVAFTLKDFWPFGCFSAQWLISGSIVAGMPTAGIIILEAQGCGETSSRKSEAGRFDNFGKPEVGEWNGIWKRKLKGFQLSVSFLQFSTFLHSKSEAQKNNRRITQYGNCCDFGIAISFR